MEMNYEIELLKWIQSFSSPLLDSFFQFITLFGEETTFIIILAFLYWTVSKQAGTFLAFALFTSYLINNGLKDTFQYSRPIGIEGIRSLRVETATGYSFPSGHTQSTTTFFTSLLLLYRKKWFTILSIVLILLVALSRLYLGVHFPKDVIAGIIIGVIISCGLFLLFKEKFNSLPIYLFFTLLFSIGFLFFQSEDYVKAYGTFLGFVVGTIFENHFVHFSTKGTRAKKVIRFIVGLSFLFLIKSVGKMILPDVLFFDGLRYFLISFFAIGLYPYIFTKLKL